MKSSYGNLSRRRRPRWCRSFSIHQAAALWLNRVGFAFNAGKRNRTSFASNRPTSDHRLVQSVISDNLYWKSPLVAEFRGGKFYQFKILCFGLVTALWAFTKILKPIVAHLRRSGVRLIIYLDDILIINDSNEKVEADYNFVTKIFVHCGFIIIKAKSVPIGTTNIEFLGVKVNS